MTGKAPRRPLSKDVRNSILLWGGLLLLMVVALAFDRITKGDTLAQVVGNLPWGWILLAGVSFLAAHQLMTRPLEPEMERVLSEALEAHARREHSCRHCGRPRQDFRVLCSACGKVVDWPGLLTAVVFALAILLAVVGRLRP